MATLEASVAVAKGKRSPNAAQVAGRSRQIRPLTGAATGRQALDNPEDTRQAFPPEATQACLNPGQAERLID